MDRGERERKKLGPVFPCWTGNGSNFRRTSGDSCAPYPGWLQIYMSWTTIS